jgi:hypothetical protein
MKLSPMAMHTDASAPQNDWIRLPVTAARQDCRQAMTGNAESILTRFSINQIIEHGVFIHFQSDNVCLSLSCSILSPMAMHTDASAPQNDWIRLPVTAARQDCRQAIL